MGQFQMISAQIDYSFSIIKYKSYPWRESSSLSYFEITKESIKHKLAKYLIEL